jgi:hypothetical protein
MTGKLYLKLSFCQYQLHMLSLRRVEKSKAEPGAARRPNVRQTNTCYSCQRLERLQRIKELLDQQEKIWN